MGDIQHFRFGPVEDRFDARVRIVSSGFGDGQHPINILDRGIKVAELSLCLHSCDIDHVIVFEQFDNIRGVSARFIPPARECFPMCPQRPVKSCDR